MQKLQDSRIARILVGVILSACVAAPTVFAAGSTEKAGAEKPTLIWLTAVQGGRDPQEITLFDNAIEKYTGVKVNMIKPPSSEYDSKLTTMLATGEPLDIAYMDAGIFEQLYAQNPQIFTPLTKWIEQSKVLSDPKIIPASEWNRIRRSNGEIYAVFNKFEGGTMPIIRMDWLKKLNLPVPQTLDDYYNVLKAFTKDDPDGNGKNDTYGLAVGYTLYDMSGLFGSQGLMRGFQKDASGKLYSPFATDKAIPVYQFLARLYKEGILEPNFVTNQSSNFRDLFMSGKAGMTFYWGAWVGLFNQMVHAKNPGAAFDAEGIPPPEGPGGRILRSGDDGLMVIPSVSKHKEDAFKVLEFWHTHQGNVLSSIGIEGHDYTITDGKWALTDIGKQHAMDHGAPYPKSLEWKNPFGEPQGYENAAQIILKYGRPQMITKYDSQWEQITRAEAAKIILGQESASEGIQNMNQKFKEAGIFN